MIFVTQSGWEVSRLCLLRYFGRGGGPGRHAEGHDQGQQHHQPDSLTRLSWERGQRCAWHLHEGCRVIPEAGLSDPILVSIYSLLWMEHKWYISIQLLIINIFSMELCSVSSAVDWGCWWDYQHVQARQVPVALSNLHCYSHLEWFLSISSLLLFSSMIFVIQRGKGGFRIHSSRHT